MIRLAAVLILAATAAQAQQFDTCAKSREQWVSTLTAQFGESLAGAGLTPQGGLVEVFASPETGSWTILVTGPDGVTCLVSSGEFWEGFEPAKPGSPA